MIAQAIGRVYTNNGSFLFTSRHKKESFLPSHRKDLFVGAWEYGLHVPTLIKPHGDYVVEFFLTPMRVEMQSNHVEDEDEINQKLEDARLADENVGEPSDLVIALREMQYEEN